jgi:oxygen-independent coproporphyrinogen-3 oxidase
MMNKLGIYIHIPFCVKKCDYCDFLSAPSDSKTMKSYVRALINEIKLNKEKMNEYLVDSVFIGGGTPSILDENLILEIMNTLKMNCHMETDAEITIECNPETVTKEKLLTYMKAGINRISFGLQSANDKELKSIGRIHTYAQFVESYKLARECGFKNINIDLMSALPKQNTADYLETLQKVKALKPEHISAYSLIVEDGTKLKKRVEQAEKNGYKILPEEKEERNMYYATQSELKKEGYNRYEISNYAKSGFECRHNIGYWQRKEYLGFGIGAASLYKEERYNNKSDINFYIKQLLKTDNSEDTIKEIEESRQKLSEEEQMEEFMFLGLRMMKGISVKTFYEKFDKSYEDVYGKVSDKLLAQGLLEKEKDCIYLTERGIDISNYVMSEFLF